MWVGAPLVPTSQVMTCSSSPGGRFVDVTGVQCTVNGVPATSGPLSSWPGLLTWNVADRNRALSSVVAGTCTAEPAGEPPSLTAYDESGLRVMSATGLVAWSKMS